MSTLEERRAYHRTWSAKNREKIKAYPSRLSLERKAYKKRYLQENREQLKPTRKRAAQAYRKRNKDWLQNYKKALVCAKCGEANPICLDFHHRDPATKLFTIRNGVNRGIAKMLAEIAKCEVLCGNCHRKITYPHLVVEELS